MHLYNNKGIICKYDCIEDIMKEFYLIRLVYYDKRKDYMLKNMQKELDIYQSKVRFIQEFIDGTINILNKEDEDIYNLLEEKNYPKFGIEEDLNDDKNYDYLLNMKIRTLTKKKIEELKKLYENKLALYNELMSKSNKDLWKEDLNNFLEVYKKKLEQYNQSMSKELENLNNLKNKSVKKTKK
jgi:DNA topoisomerase-2